MGSKSGLDYERQRLAAVTTALLDTLDVLAEYDRHRARDLRDDFDTNPDILHAFQAHERQRVQREQRYA